jgi:hypothetical protein
MFSLPSFRRLPLGRCQILPFIFTFGAGAPQWQWAYPVSNKKFLIMLQLALWPNNGG